MQLERSSIIDELKSIMEKFVESGWDLISIPAQQWLDGKYDEYVLTSAIKQAGIDLAILIILGY